MQKFERFIIYPMLFIALFFSFAGDEVQQTTAQKYEEHIITKRITVLDNEENRMVEINGSDRKGIKLYNSLGNNTMSLGNSNDGAGGLFIFNEKSKPILIFGNKDDKQGTGGVIIGLSKGKTIYELMPIGNEEMPSIGSIRINDTKDNTNAAMLGNKIMSMDSNGKPKVLMGIFGGKGVIDTKN